jgi:hypothetical protein
MWYNIEIMRELPAPDYSLHTTRHGTTILWPKGPETVAIVRHATNTEPADTPLNPFDDYMHSLQELCDIAPNGGFPIFLDERLRHHLADRLVCSAASRLALVESGVVTEESDPEEHAKLTTPAQAALALAMDLGTTAPAEKSWDDASGYSRLVRGLDAALTGMQSPYNRAATLKGHNPDRRLNGFRGLSTPLARGFAGTARTQSYTAAMNNQNHDPTGPKLRPGSDPDLHIQNFRPTKTSPDMPQTPEEQE